MMGYGMWDNGTFGFGWGNMVFMILWWVIIIGAIAWAIRWILDKKNDDRDKSALEVLKERYAKGEIERSEFEEKKRDLP